MKPVLELRATPRAWNLADLGHDAGGGDRPDHTVVEVVDHGVQYDRERRRVNVARRDPWLFRAAETTPRIRHAADRFDLHCALLHVFALTDLTDLFRRFEIDPQGVKAIRLSTARAGAAASMPSAEVALAELLDGPGQESIRRLRLQCIAGHAARMITASGDLTSLLRRGRAALTGNQP